MITQILLGGIFWMSAVAVGHLGDIKNQLVSFNMNYNENNETNDEEEEEDE